MSLSTYSSPPHPLTQPPGCCGFINLHPRTSLLLRNRFTRVNSPPPSQGLRIWSFSRDGLWACRWAVRRVNLLFPPLHFFADLLSSLSEAVGERICPPGAQTHFSSRQNLFLLWGLMRALVCRSLPHAGGGSPRQLPHLPSKALIEIPVLFSPPPPSSFSLPPLLLLRPCTHSNLPTAWSAASRHSRPSSQSTPKNFHPGAKWNFTQQCHTAPPHCIAL